MKQIKNLIFWKILLLVVLVISLIPIIYISRYNHSCADDYTYGVLTKIAWYNSHSVIQVIKGSIETVRYFYHDWQGTWAATFLLSLHPGIFGEKFYFLSTLLLLLAITGGTIYFFRTITKVYFGATDIGDICGIAVLLLSIQLLPSAVEGFFWWNGSIFYVFFYSLLLIFAAQLLIVLEEDKCSNIKIFGLSILGGVIGGGNYVTALLVVEVLALYLLVCRMQKKKVFWRLTIIAICSVIGFVISVIAPGNTVRQNNYQVMNPLRAIMFSYMKAYQWMAEWSTPFLFILLIFLFPFIIKLYEKKRESRADIPLWTIIILLFSFFASSFTPTLYAMGYEGEGRTQNIRFFLWIIVCVLAEMIIVGRIFAFTEKKGWSKSISELFSIISDREVMSGLAFIIVCALFFFFSNYNTDGLVFTSVSAAKSIYNGEAKAYDEEAAARIDELLENKKVVELEEFKVKPYVLFFSDLDYDSNNWRNMAVANYFGKDKVFLKKREQVL